jgi:hypothetical protein
MKRFAALVIPFLATVTVGAPASAQSGLERVDELTRLGRAEEARAVLLRWWDESEGSASRSDLQRALWLRGRLTVDPLQAELDFQRLAVLYPSGQFTPDAVLRLAQASFEMGNEEAAGRYMATLTRDYPSSEARARGDAWLAGAGPLPPPGDTPTRRAGTEASTTTPVRVVRPVDEAPGRVTPPVPAGREPAAGEAAVGGPALNYYVQLGAFADDERALALFDEVRAAGVDARVVRVEGSRFTHVRVGRFAQREAAVELLDELTARGINAALVRDDRPEVAVRD